MDDPASAPLIEMFASVQGEGRYVGVPMAFVRLARCPIRCTYCDTPDSYVAPPVFTVRAGSGSTAHDNPIEAGAAADLAVQVAAGNPFGTTGWVSITGGEPLLHPGFVAALGTALRQRGLRVLLETAALDPVALAQCIDAVDHLSADLKLPGTLLVGDAGRAGAQSAACVELAIERGRSVDVKAVVTESVDDAGFRAGLEALRPLAAGFQFIVQPVTPFGVVSRPCPPSQVARLARMAAAAGLRTRVLPQAHKMLGVD